MAWTWELYQDATGEIPYEKIRRRNSGHRQQPARQRLRELKEREGG